jgi:hypothetical protein
MCARSIETLSVAAKLAQSFEANDLATVKVLIFQTAQTFPERPSMEMLFSLLPLSLDTLTPIATYRSTHIHAGSPSSKIAATSKFCAQPHNVRTYPRHAELICTLTNWRVDRITTICRRGSEGGRPLRCRVKWPFIELTL